MEHINRTVNTRNQSTVQYSHTHIFLFNNRFSEAVFVNKGDKDILLKPGTLLIRDTENGAQVVPAVSGDTLVNIIGVVSTDSSLIIAPKETENITFCHSGVVNKNLLVLPEEVTLNTLVDGKTVGDLLEGLGFDLEGSVENTKFDN